MTAHHPGEQLLLRYARGDEDIPADELWAVESHLETCAACRGRLAPEPVADAVWLELAPLLDHTPQMTSARPWRRRLAGWVSPAAGPWLAMILVVTFVAVLLDRLTSLSPDRVSLVLLVAPVLPVLGVAASWSRALDPAYELAAATPRAGLPLVLRRTAAVLAVVVPGLLAAGSSSGAALAQWLLPCLAFTAGTLALGGLIGVTRAAIALIAVWAVAIVAPTVALSRTSVAFAPAAVPVWAAALALGLLVIALRRTDFTRLRANR
ncbi:zf-HC2 domain-containing protein [Lentzea sp. BCCO 10_0061]|uniref:Zf-HC2 domain-containing protein n=1 Tax=Lentzea sokolovensis TaxID=3095429 RepID=A0ABU4URH2_9PSEU|nr:zf-HC2 domain-containing protein [Lentzea sp. BCCO 10_0061]MDX8142026.1 zf-HC2 domain-containing protein [Lentzea sp. BCCO 10_0061]